MKPCQKCRARISGKRCEFCGAVQVAKGPMDWAFGGGKFATPEVVWINGVQVEVSL